MKQKSIKELKHKVSGILYVNKGLVCMDVVEGMHPCFI